MADTIPVDPEALRADVRDKYGEVALRPDGQFHPSRSERCIRASMLSTPAPGGGFDSRPPSSCRRSAPFAPAVLQFADIANGKPLPDAAVCEDPFGGSAGEPTPAPMTCRLTCSSLAAPAHAGRWHPAW
ncbi:MAG: hypothetical protein ACRD0U_19815 [Acidimicrobiales bacterium]